MYIVFRLNPDGDSYSIQNDLNAAKAKFEEWKGQEVGDNGIVLAEITDTDDFGFGARGDMYGVNVIEDSWNDEESELDEMSKLQQAAGIKK